MPVFCEICARLRNADSCPRCGGPTFDATQEEALAALHRQAARGRDDLDQRLDAILLRLPRTGATGPLATDARAIAKLVQRHPARGRVQLIFALTCHRAGNLVGAIRATSLALRLAPERYSPPRGAVDRLVTRVAQIRREQLEAAAPVVEDALELGRLRALFGDYAGALEAYESALPARGHDLELLAAAGLALRLLGRPREAIELYDRILAAAPDFAMGHNNLAAACADLGDVARTERAATAAVQLDPKLGSAMISLGTLYLEVGRPNAALSALWEAEARDAELLPTAAILRAAGYLADDNAAKARDEIETASEHPRIHSTPQIGFVRATVLERQERAPEAAAALATLWEMAVG